MTIHLAEDFAALNTTMIFHNKVAKATKRDLLPRIFAAFVALL